VSPNCRPSGMPSRWFSSLPFEPLSHQLPSSHTRGLTNSNRFAPLLVSPSTLFLYLVTTPPSTSSSFLLSDLSAWLVPGRALHNRSYTSMTEGPSSLRLANADISYPRWARMPLVNNDMLRLPFLPLGIGVHLEPAACEASPRTRSGTAPCVVTTLRIQEE